MKADYKPIYLDPWRAPLQRAKGSTKMLLDETDLFPGLVATHRRHIFQESTKVYRKNLTCRPHETHQRRLCEASETWVQPRKSKTKSGKPESSGPSQWGADSRKSHCWICSSLERTASRSTGSGTSRLSVWPAKIVPDFGSTGPGTPQTSFSDAIENTMNDASSGIVNL